MKLLHSILVGTVFSCGKIVGVDKAKKVVDGVRPRIQPEIVPEEKLEPRAPEVPEEPEQIIKKEDQWYSINDGVMGGISTGSASWYSLNDGVMGGLSSGASVPNNDYLVYKGELSLENNGGFSQIRHDVEADKFSGAQGVTLHVRATEPNRKFKFIASASSSDWNLNIWEKSLTVGTEWTEVKINFSAMDLQIMGKIIPNGEKLTGKMIKKIGFMIMDKNTAPFELHVKDIRPNTEYQEPQKQPEQDWYSLNDGVMGGISSGSADWYSVNDGVMGGISSGSASTVDKHLVYKGQLSLENNGGFSQIRHDTDDFTNAKGVRLTLKSTSSGRDFKFIASASTTDWNPNIWEKSVVVGTEETTIDIMFDDMDMQVMGKIIPGAQKLTGEMVKKIGFLIMDKNTDPFELHVLDIQPITTDQKPAEPKMEKWYSLNDGVMGGVSSGSAKWYSLNDGVMGGISSGSADWYSLNDGVMGGVSTGSASSEDKYLVYKGQLSLENNGGFSQIRHDTDDFDGATGVRLTLKSSATGRDFKFIASASTSDWNLNIWEKSLTVGTEAASVDIMFSDMDLQIMGKIVPNGQKLTGEMIKKIGFMIMDKNTEPFELHIMSITPLGKMAHQKTDHTTGDHSQDVHSSVVDYADYFDHRWYSVNDDVMGGKSAGHFALDDETSEFLFWGQLSFENNGGFASIRTSVESGDLDNSDGISAVITGDGRRYKFTSHKKGSYGMWSTEFNTEPGKKLTIHFPYDEMKPTFMGRPNPAAGKVNVEDIDAVGFMMSDKNPDMFKLKIHHLKPYSRDSEEKWDKQEYHPHNFNADHGKSSDNLANWYTNNWYARNDDVMGGVSHGSPARNKQTHNLKFWGQLSLENNGGFSTIRTDVTTSMDGACGVDLHVRGDGRKYQFTAYPADMKGRYQADVQTVAGEDTSASFMFSDLEYHFWGWKKPMKPLTADNVKGLGFMIADKNTDPFELEIVSLKPNYNCDGSHSTDSHMKSDGGVSNLFDLEWYSLNDGVMGGVSSGSIKKDKSTGYVKYHGQLSLENNGGFSTIRANVPKVDRQATGVQIKLMGDARAFKLNLGKSTSDWNLNAWTYTLSPTSEWTTVKIPFAAFKHEIMGRAPSQIQDITASEVEKISVSISDKITTPFMLNIASLEFY